MSKPSKTTNHSQSANESHGFRQLMDLLKDIPVANVAEKLGIDISSFIPAGGNLTGECPMGHASTSGRSFHITPGVNLHHCWSCHIGGDNLTLVEKVKNCSFVEATEWLINTFNIPIDLSSISLRKRTPEEIKEDTKQRTFTVLYEELIEWGKNILYKNPTNDPKVQDAFLYLTVHRKYDPGILLKTEFFYIPSTQEARDHLLTVFPEYTSEIKEIRIAGGGFQDEMKINFPYRNSQGVITGLMKRHHTQAGYSRTNPNGTSSLFRWDATPGMDKSDMFGLYGLKKNNKNATEAVIVEGYPDVMYMQVLGMPILAAGSAKPNPKQLDSLLKLKSLRSVTLCLDNDDVGKGNLAGLLQDITKRSGLIIEVLPQEELENYKDLDEYFRNKGDIETRKLLETKAILGVVWFISRLKNSEGKIRPAALEEIYDLLANSNSTTQSIVLGNSKQYLNLPISSLRSILNNREIQKWNYLYNLDTAANPIFSWDKVPFTSRDGYGVLDRTKEVPAPERMSVDEIADLSSFEKAFISSKGRSHVEDMVRGYLNIPPVLPYLDLVYDPKTFFEIDPLKRVINTFVPTKWMYYNKTDEIINHTEFPVIYDFIDHLLGQDEGVSTHHILNWISVIFNGRKKIRTSLILTGAQGAGKNIFIDYIIKYLFGFPNVSVVGNAQLQDSFNEYLSGKLMIVFNELSPLKESSRHAQTFLKALVTDGSYNENGKFVRLKQMIAWFNFIFISNFLSPVAIDVDDRRFTCIKVPDEKLEFSAFFKRHGWRPEDFDKFRGKIEEEFPRFVQYLVNMDYDEELANTAIMNTTKMNMIEDNNTIFIQFAELLKRSDIDQINFLQQDGSLFANKEPFPWEEDHRSEGIIECNQALNIINQMSTNFKTGVNQKTLNGQLTERGIVKMQLRIDCPWEASNRPYFYVMPDSPHHPKNKKPKTK